MSYRHWKREASGKWDAGYQHTGYFLDYLEHRYGLGTISKLNEKLRTDHYKEKRFWTELLGRPVGQLWKDYVEALEAESTLTKPRKSAETVSEDDDTVLVNRDDVANAEKSNVTPTQTISEKKPVDEGSEGSAEQTGTESK
jgi:hypothetical protein